MLLWSKALALEAGRAGADEEWQWWVAGSMHRSELRWKLTMVPRKSPNVQQSHDTTPHLHVTRQLRAALTEILWREPDARSEVGHVAFRHSFAAMLGSRTQ
jgi:hypothetical protein